MNTSLPRPTALTIALICLPLLATAAGTARAADFGVVLSSTPVVASVPVVQRECIEEPVLYPQRSTGAGALVGAIAGAAVGNSIGSGAGRAAATGIGLILGSQIGDRVEAGNAPPVASTVQRCSNVTRYERRTVGYDVVYEYQGVRRTARLAQDPGERIALDVQVTPAGRGAAAVPPPATGEANPQPYPQPYARQPYAQPHAQPYPQPYDPAYDAREVQPYPQPGVVYASPQMVVNPWPAIAIGAAIYGGYRYSSGGRGWGGYGHRH